MIPIISKLKCITIKVFREFLKVKNPTNYAATSSMSSGDEMDAACRKARDPCTSPGSPHCCRAYCCNTAAACKLLYPVRQPLAALRAAARNGRRNPAQTLGKLIVLAEGRTGRVGEEGLEDGARAMGTRNRVTLLIKASHTSKHIESVF